MLPWPIAEEKLPMFPVLAMSPESVEFEPPNKDEAKPDIIFSCATLPEAQVYFSTEDTPKAPYTQEKTTLPEYAR